MIKHVSRHCCWSFNLSVYSSSNHHPSLPVVRGKTAGQFCFPSILLLSSISDTGAGACPSCHRARGWVVFFPKEETHYESDVKHLKQHFFFSLTGLLVLPECSHRWQSWCELRELRCLMCALYTLTHLLLSLMQSINVVCVCVLWGFLWILFAVDGFDDGSSYSLIRCVVHCFMHCTQISTKNPLRAAQSSLQRSIQKLCGVKISWTQILLYAVMLLLVWGVSWPLPVAFFFHCKQIHKISLCKAGIVLWWLSWKIFVIVLKINEIFKK